MIRRFGCTLLAAVPFFIMMVLVGVVAHNRHSLVYTIAFKDAAGLHRGDRVLLGERAIGSVSAVRPVPDGGYLVGVRIEPKEAQSVRRGSTALIRETSRSGRRPRCFVEAINPETESPAPPLESGAQVQGVGGELELQAWRFRSAAAELGQSLKNALSPFGSGEP